MSTQKTPTEVLLSEILAFCDKAGMAESAFGRKAMRDPALISDLKSGRELRHRNMERVRAYMRGEAA